MNLVEASQLLALRAVVKGEQDYHIRRILRWYARTYATPRHVVEELPLDYVLREYFETRYEELEEDKLQEEIARLLETPEQRAERERYEAAEEADEMEFARFTEEQAKLEAEEKKKAELDNLQTQAPQSPLPVMAAPEAKLVDVKSEPVLPEIKMQFVSEEDLADEIEGFGSMDAPPKKQS